MAIDIGRIAYQAYVDQLVEHDVSAAPDKWEDVGKFRQDAWRHAAVAVLQYIRKEQELLDSGSDLEG
jgi:hypothetical protein